MQRLCRDAGGRASPTGRWPRVVIYLLHICFYRIETVESDRWLARVRHDLVKRLLWPARDRRDAGGAPAPGELVAELIDDEGAPTTAGSLWAALAAEGPRGPGLARFDSALQHAVAAAAAGDVDGVLALEAAFDELASSLARSLDSSLDGSVDPSGREEK
jgi:hypothetical protein